MTWHVADIHWCVLTLLKDPPLQTMGAAETSPSHEQHQDVPERGAFPGKSRSISSHLLTNTGPAPESYYEYIKGFPHEAFVWQDLSLGPVMVVGLVALHFIRLISLTPPFLQFWPLPTLIPTFLSVRFWNTLCRQQPSWFIVFRLRSSYVATSQLAFRLRTSKEKEEAMVIRIYAHIGRRVHLCSWEMHLHFSPSA